jgi:hypothetical protein
LIRRRGRSDQRTRIEGEDRNAGDITPRLRQAAPIIEKCSNRRRRFNRRASETGEKTRRYRA